MSPEKLDRSVLDTKDREELHAIAGALGVKAGSRMRKADLIEAILGSAPTGSSRSPKSSKSSSDESVAPRRKTVRSSSSASRDTIDALAAEEAALGGSTDVAEVPIRPRRTPSVSAGASTPAETTTAVDQAATAPATASPVTHGAPGTESTSGSYTSDEDRGGFDSNRRRRRRRGRNRNERGERGELQEDSRTEFQGEPVPCAGLLDLRDEGYGFVRTGGYMPGRSDVYVSAAQVRRFALRKGDYLTGANRPQASNEKYPALLRVDTVNGMDVEVARGRARFEDLTPLFPDEKLRLELPNDPQIITGRIIDLVSPIGKGQRGLIVSPPKAGKTTIMKQIVHSIETNNPEVHLMVLLVDERPEEVTDMRRHVQRGEVVASTFDRPSDEHTHVSELTIERAKRLVEMGKDVVIILDGITRLARAYNLAAPASGRILSGGVDSSALYPPKKFFGAARNVEEGGSLTILATALVETGSRMDEVIFEEFKGTGNMELRLDRKTADRRIYPAIDVEQSSTRHEELLFDRQQLAMVWKLRRVLSALEGDGRSGAGLELLIDKLKTTKSNDEFLSEIAKNPTPGA
ncbi:MAG: transcription termination factor Rho [Acidimicrobiia bacterium]